jgi:hypothetical protein
MSIGITLGAWVNLVGFGKLSLVSSNITLDRVQKRVHGGLGLGQREEVGGEWARAGKMACAIRHANGHWYVSNVSIFFDAPFLFLHHLLCVLFTLRGVFMHFLELTY